MVIYDNVDEERSRQIDQEAPQHVIVDFFLLNPLILLLRMKMTSWLNLQIMKTTMK